MFTAKSHSADNADAGGFAVDSHLFADITLHHTPSLYWQYWWREPIKQAVAQFLHPRTGAAGFPLSRAMILVIMVAVTGSLVMRHG